MKNPLVALLLVTALTCSVPFAASAETPALPDGIECDYIGGQLWLFAPDKISVNISLATSTENNDGWSDQLRFTSAKWSQTIRISISARETLLACDAEARAKQ